MLIDKEMVTCKTKNCKTGACFGYESDMKIVSCKQHKKTGMVNVKDKYKQCKNINCSKIASFGFEENRIKLYCVEHKEELMINLKDKICTEANCKKQAVYGYENDKIKIKCFDHKENDMANLKNKVCEFNDCNIRACYNYVDKVKPIYCVNHKKEKMSNVVAATCIYSNCMIIPSYNYANTKKVLYCNEHKLENMINIRDKRCLNNCGVITTNSRYNGYCARCYASLYPDKPMARNIKTKERAVVSYIMEKFPKYSWIFDKKIENGSSLRRPDASILFDNRMLIIEIDENQHRSYDCSCDNKRTMELSKDIKHMPMVLIRFNPDCYYNNDNVKIKSCWSHKKDTGSIYINNEHEWNERLISLKLQIDYWLSNTSTKTVEIIELYYNQN